MRRKKNLYDDTVTKIKRVFKRKYNHLFFVYIDKVGIKLLATSEEAYLAVYSFYAQKDEFLKDFIKTVVELRSNIPDNKKEETIRKINQLLNIQEQKPNGEKESSNN